MNAWRDGDYSVLAGCFTPLKRILRKKATKRPGRRFFGEALVAASAGKTEGWYSSFKWLTSPKWWGNQALSDTYQRRFRAALLRHFPELREFQGDVRLSTRSLRERKPVGPDLWLIDGNQHGFIEAKLPGDHVARHQLVPLALIAILLHSDRPVSVEVATLYSGAKPTGIDGMKKEFAAIVTELKTFIASDGGGRSTTKSSRRRNSAKTRRLSVGR